MSKRTKRAMTNKEKASIDVEWICPKCNTTVNVNQYDIALAGIPICPDCGDDMHIYEPDEIGQ